MKAVLLSIVTALAPFASAQTTCPHPGATLITPANGATGVPSPVMYTWSATPGALGYEVWASFDGSDFLQVGGTSDTALVDDVPPGTQVEWYVTTNYPDCKSDSLHFKFATAACPTGIPSLLNPPNGASSVSSPVTFSWSSVDGASGYRLWVSKDGSDYDVFDETDETKSTIYLEPGVYDWFVETFFDSCESTESADGRFTIPRAANCPTTGANLLAPAEGATSTTNVHFSWAPVPGAIQYQVWAALDDGDFDFIDATATTSTDADLGSGRVTWVVIAQFNGCDDTLSRFGQFDIPFDPECDISSPLLFTPADGDTDVPLKVSFIWTPVDGATGYKVWVAYGTADPQIAGTSTVPRLAATLTQPGEVTWFVETTFASCPSDYSPANTFQASASAVCKTPEAPQTYVDSEVMSGDPYIFIWSPGLNTASYEVQESTKENFSDAKTIPTSDILVTLRHEVSVATRYYYRVRSLSSCGLGNGPFSDVAAIVVLPSTTSADDVDLAASYGTQTVVVERVHVPGGAVTQNFTASVDKPWLTVTPSSGSLPPAGIDLTVTAQAKDLPLGSSNATIRLTTLSGPGLASKRTLGDPPAGSGSVPISVNLVAPVSPNAGNPPVPSSLIIPTLTHTSSAGARSQSDLRIANVSAQTMRYQLNFTPSGVDGTKVGQQLTIQVNAGETAALNDVLKNFFGYATAGDNVAGQLEIRPLTTGTQSTAAASVTVATSRSYTTVANGTYGTSVPAISFTQFISRPKDPSKSSTLNLQQIAESSKYHTSIGLVEAAGEPATVQLAVFSNRGDSLGTFSVDLKPGEHKQLNDFFTQRSLQVADGRVEVSVTSATGKVTAYATVTDAASSDSVLISPVPAPAPAARYVIPGVADFSNIYARWRSDIRLYNASAAASTLTLTFYPQNEAAKSATVDVGAHEVKVIESVVQSLFGMQNAGGSIAVTASGSTPIIASARTYSQAAAGTYAEFIPAITPADAVGVGSRALQIVQLEESDRFRTNLGIAEVVGSPAVVELSVVTTDSKVAVKTQVPLQANEFMQINRVLAKFGYPTTYNGRITLKVISGAGKIAGYASMIDNKTQDPTYIPAQ